MGAAPQERHACACARACATVRVRVSGRVLLAPPSLPPSLPPSAPVSRLRGCDAQDGLLRRLLQLAADEQLVEDVVRLRQRIRGRR
eukprot:4526830-Pleurochrysis_carterae.AAC.2